MDELRLAARQEYITGLMQVLSNLNMNRTSGNTRSLVLYAGDSYMLYNTHRPFVYSPTRKYVCTGYNENEVSFNLPVQEFNTLQTYVTTQTTIEEYQIAVRDILFMIDLYQRRLICETIVCLVYL